MKEEKSGQPTAPPFGLDQCPLHRKNPFLIRNVSMSQLSIARHYGGIKYNGDSYTYIPYTDELIRDDVLKWQRKNAKPHNGGSPESTLLMDFMQENPENYYGI